jgi:serine protease Do
MQSSRRLIPLCALSAGLLLAAGCSSLPMTQSTPAKDPAIERVMDKVYPALVRIYVIASDYDSGKETKGMAAGSGSIISPDGYVVTNHHVVGHAKKIWCTLPGRERVDAELIGTDPLTDIAIIRLRPETMRHPVKSFPFAKWGDSDKVVTGQRVFAMGSPGAIAQSVTCGIVANPNIVMPGNSMVLDGESVGSLVRWIFHDAQIYHGNSGGPLVNSLGEIVGINELGTAALGGAIPANTARNTAEQLIKNKGSVMRSWTGLNFQKLFYQDQDERGAMISYVNPDSPAAKAGILSGDKVLSINGEAITYRYDEELPGINRLLLSAPVGSALKLKVLRDGKEINVDLVTELRGLVQAQEKECGSWGITAADLNRFTAPSYKLKPGEGVQVTTIRSGGPADQAKPRLGGGDVIVKVGDQKVGTLEDLAAVTKARTKDKKEPVPTMVTFRRGQDELLTVVDLGPEQDPTVIPMARKAWFSGSVQIFTKPLAEAMGVKDLKGVRIIRLFPQLEKSGLMVGDIITHIDDKVVEAYDPSHSEVFPTMVRTCSIVDPTVFTVLRNGKTEKVSVTLPIQPKPANEMATYKNEFFDFKVRDLCTLDKIGLEMPLDSKGIIVDSVGNGGWANLGGLGNGDVIKKVNGKEITTRDDLKTILNDCEKTHADSIIFFVKRGRGHCFLEVRPNWEK